MIRTLQAITLAVALAALAAPTAAQQGTQPEREVVVLTPGKLDMALAHRGELALTDQQVRRLEEIRTEAERKAAAVLNAEQNQKLAQRQERMRAMRGPGQMGLREECERTEGGQVECRRFHLPSPGTSGPGMRPDAEREFEVCERPSGAAQGEERCRTVRVRGGMGPMGAMMMFGHPGMMPGMPMPRTVRERCTTDAEGKERCEVVRFRMHRGDMPGRPMPMDTTGANCERSTDEQGNERVICRREVNQRRGTK